MDHCPGLVLVFLCSYKSLCISKHSHSATVADDRSGARASLLESFDVLDDPFLDPPPAASHPSNQPTSDGYGSTAAPFNQLLALPPAAAPVPHVSTSAAASAHQLPAVAAVNASGLQSLHPQPPSCEVTYSEGRFGPVVHPPHTLPSAQLPTGHIGARPTSQLPAGHFAGQQPASSTATFGLHPQFGSFPVHGSLLHEVRPCG